MNKKRLQVQEEATKTILQRAFMGIYDIAPRVGKSKIVIDALKSLPDDYNVLITVPFNPIIDDGRGNGWINEFVKWELPEQKRPKVINQRSLHKEEDNYYDVIICDEIHSLSDRQLNEIRRVKKGYGEGILWQNNKQGLMGMTGSLGDATRKKLFSELGLTVEFEYTIDHAINDGIIADYSIEVVMLPLSNTEKVKVNTKHKTYFTTERKRYVSVTQMFEKFKAMAWNVPRYNTTKMRWAGIRSRFIYSAPSKVALAKSILNQHDRALVFAALTDVADDIAGVGYHTKSNGDEIIDFFNGDINKLGVVDMTSMGITFPDLKVGIFHQMKSSEEMAIQKVLRMCNLERGSGDAKIYICCYAGTVDEDWVRKALKPFSSDRISYTYEPPYHDTPRSGNEIKAH